jgi:hypothetical protein
MEDKKNLQATQPNNDNIESINESIDPDSLDEIDLEEIAGGGTCQEYMSCKGYSSAKAAN